MHGKTGCELPSQHMLCLKRRVLRSTALEWQSFAGIWHELGESTLTLRTDLAKALVLTMDSSSHIHFMALWRTQVVASPCSVGEQHALSHTASCGRFLANDTSGPNCRRVTRSTSSMTCHHVSQSRINVHTTPVKTAWS